MHRETQSLRPSTEEIARLAYLIWDKEGRPQGCDVEHWCEAESLLLAATRKELKSLHAATTLEHARKQRRAGGIPRAASDLTRTQRPHEIIQ